MVRKAALILGMMAVVFIAVSAYGELSKTMPIKKERIITGDEPMVPGPVIPYGPRTITQSPGVIVGTTYYDYQSNGSSGRRIVVMSDRSKAVAWMNGINWPSPRHVYHNWADPSGGWSFGQLGCQVNTVVGAGYCQIDRYSGYLTSVAFHTPRSAGQSSNDIKLAIETEPAGFCSFSLKDPPETMPGSRYGLWPYFTVDRNNRIHVVMTESVPAAGDPQRFYYTRSVDGGNNWTVPQYVDTVMVIAGVVEASPVSDKVAIIYSKTQDTSTQWYNDIVYIMSNDGLTWDFTRRTNVTNYATDTDSLWAYTDLAAVFDYNDNLHIIWNAQWVTSSGIYYKTFLKHYNSGTGQIRDVTTPWPDSYWVSSGCDFGAWNRPMCKMSLGVYSRGPVQGIFATWTQFDTSDCSAGGYANGDIWYSYMTLPVGNWSPRENLTNSHTDDCFPGECDSDHWSSLARTVDDSVRILYVNDKDAGGIPQTEGAATQSPMMYLAFWNPLASSVEGEAVRPVNFELLQNYPNPFNASTVISFELKQQERAKVEVFDITGAKVATLVDKVLPAGHHEVTWRADRFASGVYYYRLTAGEGSQTKQMVLLK